MQPIENDDWIDGLATSRLWSCALRMRSIHFARRSHMEFEPGVPRDNSTRIPQHVLQGSLWMRLGFIAFSIAAAALVALFSGDAPPFKALVWAIVAGATGAFAFRRSWMLVNRDDASIVTNGTQPAIARATTT